MSLLHYSDPKNFWSAVVAAGVPYVRITLRKAIFREADLEAWLDQRTVGARTEGLAK